MTKNFLEINNVDFNVGGTTKVKNVSFSIQNEGEIICFKKIYLVKNLV